MSGELDEALRRALDENGLDESYRPDVMELLETPRDQWRACCGSFCDPCVLTLWRVADRVRRLCPDAPRP